MYSPVSRVVVRDRDRRTPRSVAAERTWRSRRQRATRVTWRRVGRQAARAIGTPLSELPAGGGGAIGAATGAGPGGGPSGGGGAPGGTASGGVADRSSAGGQRCALHRRVDPVVEVDAVVGRDALRDQVRVERVRPEDVLAHRQSADSPWGRCRVRPWAPACRGDPCTGSCARRGRRSASPAAACSTARPGCRSIVSSAGLRHCDGGRKPTVHGGGSVMVSAKSPDGRPVGLFFGSPKACCAAMMPGKITRSCSSDGL